ncbi:MAG: inositol monophosphatase family protein [Rhodospirillales bacterium]|jgi:myo-inositol-1(or 4)-monophosphatase
MRRTPVMTMMIRAAEKAGRAIVRDFGEVEHLQASNKGPRDFVLKADEKASRILREELEKARPRFGLLMDSEEEAIGSDTSHRFIADPIDGTTNFMHGLPQFAVSVALEESREVIAGVVYNPVTDELFWAERNEGAYLHDRRIRVSRRTHLSEALVGGSPLLSDAQDPEEWSVIFSRLAKSCTIRIVGAASISLVHVAAGRLDGYVEAGVRPWEVAAGVIIVQEAGGIVTDFKGGAGWLKSGQIVAASGELHGQLLSASVG